MTDDERVERRSMVGAPPTSARRVSSLKISRSTPRSAAKFGKRKKDDESEDDSSSDKHENESEAGDQIEEDSGDDHDGNEVPGRPKRKRRRPHLTDSAARTKRRNAKKAAMEEAHGGEETAVEVKSPTPPPVQESPEPVIKTPSIGKYSPLQLMCDHILRKVMSKDPEEYFAFPVTPAMAPDYHTIISQPMDFSKIRQKIEDDAYNNIPEMRVDSELIVSNALTYNNPNTVYHIAATRLSSITRYYFSEQYLRYIFHTLPFANQVSLEKAGLAPLVPIYQSQKTDNKRRQALVDDMRGDECLKAADISVRSRLSIRLPNAKMAFLDNKDGATVLNVVGEGEMKGLRLADIVGPLEEGTPGMLSLGDHRLSGQSTISYLNYGPFCSFAPQYDSTWATLTKRDSDLLLRTYGDRSTVSDVMSLRNMVTDAGAHFIKVVDDLLDTLTDGEHSRTIQCLENKNDKVEPKENVEDIAELINELESLENLGVDVGFLEDVRLKLGLAKPTDLQAQLDANGRAVLDLARMQHQRLSQPPPITLTKVAQPSLLETQLAANVQQQLANQVAMHAQPNQIVTAPAIHDAIGIHDEFDMDILGEFFVT